MKRPMLVACAAVFAMLPHPLCLAADSPWDGTWVLNPAKSTIAGATLTYYTNENGTLHFSNGGAVEYDFACNGRDYPTYAGRTISCTRIDNSVYDTTTKVDGKTATVSHRVISADGKLMTVSTMGEQPNGAVFNDRNNYRRVSGSIGLAGKWKNVKSSSSTPEVMILKVESGVMHTEFPGYEDRVDAKMNGTDSPVSGSTVPTGLTVSLTVEGPRRLHIVQKLHGKAMAESVQTLSPDGRTLSERTWIAGKIAEKQTYVYDKQ